MASSNFYRFYARMSSAVLVKVLLAYLGYKIGEHLDKKFQTAPYLMFACFIVGISLGLWWVIRNANAGDQNTG